MTPPVDPTIDAVYAFPGRSTRAIIDLDAIAANVGALRDLLPTSTTLMAVVKADGYGHGAVMIARCAISAGATMLGVATVGEAAELRDHQIVAPVLLLGPCDVTEVRRALELNVEISVAGAELLDAIDVVAAEMGRSARIHLKIDSGMHRYGASPADALAMADRIAQYEHVGLVGLSTHYATADETGHFASAQQAAVFEQVAAQVRVRVGQPFALHSANSAATLRGMDNGTDIARCGIAIYGIAPSREVNLASGMRPALSLMSRLARVHAGRSGDGVGYGHTYICTADEWFGLIPLGYADGYRRALSNKSWVCVGGRHCPDRGNISMDQSVVGGLLETDKPRDLVGVAGPLSGGPGFDELAELCGTIPYEMLTGLSRRIPRYYVTSGRVVATLIEGRLETV
jgi:alanine racemase